MAFLRQLKLLLWKNGLAVVRQPLWSLTLIIWPVIIFMIIAVTRKQFPPVIKETCFVGPRNLPSAGFFPFLQTLMCNTDSNCNNKSLSVDPAALKSTNRGGTRLNQLLQPADLNFNVSKNYRKDSDALIEALSSILGPFHQQGSNNVSHMNPMNTTLLGDQESLNKLLESMNMLKRAICTMTLSTMNTTSHNPLSYAVVTFCRSNNTVFEVSLNTLNQLLTELMVTKPNETMTVAAAAVMVFDKLQNHTSLWESLLAIPQLLSSGSFDQVLASAEVLLTNVQGAMNVIQNNFPEVGASLSTVHPFLAGGINMIRYAQKWPGRGVSITLGDVVTLQNDSLSEMVKRVLQEVKIPLDKAIGLTFDRDMVLSHLCENSSNPLWLTAACSTGTVNTLLGFISPDKVAKQILLVWSERVAPHDVSFAKGLLHSLMGGPSPGGQGGTRNRRSVETQPQNIEEELFLGVGKVVMEIIQTVPELDMVVDAFLKTGFQFMQSATLGLDTVEEMMENFLKDANQIQMTYLSLMTNQSAASVCISRILDSVMGILPKVMSTQSLTCKDLLGPFEWLLNTESIKIEVLRSAICQNSSALQEALLMDWLPLIQKGQDLYIALTGQGNYNLTLPMILSEWHKLYNKSMQFGMRSNRLAAQLSGEYWINWMVDNSTQDVPGILQQSVFLFMVNVGENIEKSQLWPEVKDYFHMLYWILNYRPDVTTQPANCSIDINYLSIHCNTGLKWPQFVQAMTQALMSPSQDVLMNCLKGTVNLLQNAYGDVYRNLVGTYLKQEIQGGDALSAYLINLMKNLDGFINTITMLPDQSNVTIPLIGNLLQSTGLRPLLPLLLSDGPLNASTLLDVASKLGRLNQHIFSFNETDPTMPELERLIMLFLSLEGNLTMSLSHIMGNTELTYSDYFHPDYVARLRQAIEPFTNQTSAGFVETILSAMELLKKMLDAPNGDPTNIILEYTRQLQEFLKSLYRLQKIQHQGQLSPAQVTDLHSLSKDFLDLLTQEGLQNLTQAGPDAAQNIVAQKLVAFLPPEVRQEAARFLQDFKALQYQIAKCAAGQNCLAGISEIFTFLNQISELMLSANGNVTITLAATNLVLEGREYEEITSLFFPLLLSSNDASYVESFKQTLHFIRLIMATPNITVSDVQNALQQSNLTLRELNNIAALAGAANINDLIGNIMQIINARQCFEPQHNPMVTTQCVMGLISGVSSFLTHLPAFRNETAILSLIPLIINNTISDGVQVDFSSNPNLALAHILNRTLANIKMSFQLNHMYTPEIMKEIRVVEGLIRLVANTDPFDNLNTSLLMNSGYAQKIYLEIVEWYLKRLENITSTSSASEFLAPFYYSTQMQVTSQLAYSEFSLFISKQVESLINSLQYPIDGAGVRQIGLTTVEILRRQFDLIISEVEAQNNFPGSPPLCNTTALHVIKLQVKLYLDTIEMWMKQPNVLPVLSSLLQWGNPSINVSTPVTDIQHLLGTMVNVLSADQQAYLSIISNITKSLSEALMVAEQPGGPQSDHFLAAILEAVQKAMQVVTAATGPLPLSVQQNILEIVQDSVKLAVHPDISFASSRNISLLILKRVESVIQQTLPEIAEYLLPALKVATTYFQSISAGGGPNVWNQLILDEMNAIQSFLPPNSSAQAYVSVLINITHFILESGQGNMSLWTMFESASVENLPMIFGQSVHFIAAIVQSAIQTLTGATGPLPPSVQQDILEIVQDSLKLIQPEMSFASSRNISLLILMRAESIIKQTLPEIAEYLLPALEVATQYFESISAASGPNIWNQLILDEMKTIQSLLPPNSSAQAYVSVLINITHFILESGQGNMSLWTMFESASVENLPMIFGQSVHFVAAIVQSAIQTLTGATGPLPPSVQQDILEIVQDSLKLIQPNMSFASSRNISLLILMRAESIIKQTLPEIAEYLLPALEVATQYFESISAASGPNIWNQLILDEMKTIQSLLPPNSSAQAYVCALINITHFILESGQGNMSLWAMFESASVENLPMIFGQSVHFLPAIVQSAIQTLTGTTGPLPPSVQQDILEIVQDSLKLIQPNMSFASSRNISLLILMRAESIIKQTLPEIAEYLLPALEVATQYFESISAASGPNIWNQLILDEMKTIQSLLPPNSSAQAYVCALINITHFILESGQGNMSLWAMFESASVENLPMIFGQSVHFLPAIVQSAIQTLTGATGPLPLSVQQDIMEIVQDSLKLIQPDIGFASSRNISLLILKRAESIIKQTLPEIAEYLLPALEVATQYFESISAASGPNIWNQLILDEMKTIQSLLPPNSSAQAYVCALINITHFILESGQGNMSLWASFENASVENLPMIFGQSVHFLAAIVQSAIQTLTGATGPLPLSVQQDIMEIVQDSLKLTQPDISFASSRNISLLILMRAESIIKQTLPEIAEYLLPALEIPTMYFESISAASGPNIWYQLILGEMTADQSFLPPNSPAQAFVSVLINITHFILESGQGNMSLWASSESSPGNVPMIFDQIGKLLSSLWALIMGDPGSPVSPPSLGVFAHLAPVLEQLLTGKANQHTWDKLEKILEALLSTLKGTEQWDPSVIPLLEKIIGSTVNNIQGQNALILSLQTPLLTLIREIAQSVNGSHFNLPDVSEEMQHAIERTLKAAEQANGTLGCDEVLKAWEPVREAAGLSQATVYMWCNISLQPVLKAYAASQAVYTHMNMSQMVGGPMNVSATSAGIVKAVQSFYQANINSSLVTERVISAILSQLSQLAGRPLSHEAQLYLYKQLQDMQLQNSLSSFKMLTDELVSVAPFIQPYVEAVERALRHILGNYHLLQNSSSSQDLFREAAMIFLSAANITADDIFPMMWGDLSGLNAASLPDMLRQAVRLVIDMEIFGDAPMVYRTLEQFLASNDSSVIAQKLTAMCAWLTSTQASGLDLLTQALPKIYDILRPLLSVLTQMGMDTPANTETFEDLAGNILAMLRQLVSTSGLMTPMSYHPSMYQQHNGYGNHTGRVRNRRESPLMMMAREPMDDFIDLFQIDYPAMFRAVSVPVTTAEITETVQMVFANPDLSVVIKGSTRGIPGDSSAFREKTIDAGLGLLSFFTLPAAVQMSSMDLLANAANVLPAGFPFSSALKNITRALAGESQGNLMLMAETFQKAAELFQISPMDPRFAEQLDHLRSKVCTLEKTQSVRQLMLALSIEPGQLCHTVLPSLQILTESLTMNTTALTDAIFQAFIGDPQTYNVQSNWSSVLTRGLGFNTSSLSSFNINITSPGAVTVGEMLRNKAAFVEDVQKHMNFDTAALHLLMETTLPNNNLEILSWLINLRHCSSAAALNMEETDVVILNTFCSLSVGQWYSFSLLMARHLNMEKLIYRMVLSEELQSLVRVMLQMAEVLTNMMDTILPAVGQLQTLMRSMNDINLMADPEFRDMVRGRRETLSSQATFVTLSRALCSKGIMALLGISKLPATPESNSFSDPRQREEMIERFKIPQDATPFCMNMYLDMVNTTGGAIAWAFLKPMLMGNILFTPDTPTTRAIMEKANGTLKEFGNLRKYSKDWLESSNYIMKSAEILGHTLPMLQNSLGNSFVVNFIEMQTDINVGRMKETLSNFSNMTVLLEKNKQIMKQITTLSTLMVNISSCIKFDRYRGFDSANELDTVAQDLAKNRDLYASVIFKLPKDEGSSRKRQARSSSSTSPLPPKVRYTIRMHMDNVMRTDRVRNPYYVKDNHISARLTLRYNRGFIYLQENIDRAIIETQTGQRVADPAVQLQPFPYPCFYRDEYLEAISFVFPVMLMLAWVLFVADFVKKLVYERELRLHEYMKMMGVNPLSHFFAWFLECATYLVLTIFLLTLVLKFGSILPNSDGFLLFLYLCDYGLSILSFSYLVSSFFDKTYIAGLSGSLLYILCFFPFIVVLAVETKLTFFQKSALSLFSPTCFSYASQYISRYEAQGEGILWSNSYTSPIAGDMASFGWLCWLMLIDSILYFIIGAYIRMVFPGKYGIPAPWYFPFKASFWADLCCCIKSNSNVGKGLLFTNIMQTNQPVFSDDKGKGKSTLTSQAGEDFSELPVGVALHGLSKSYGDRVAIENLNVSFYEGHVTSLLGHNGAGKTTTMSLLTGLFAPSSGTIEVYGRDMQTNIDDVRRELGVCMQYDVLFEHMTTKEHLLLYGQIKAPQWSPKELHEQVRTILEETGMYAHRHKRVGTLSGGMKRKLSISIAFIGGSRLVVLDEPTTGVDPCSRRNIWDIVIQYKKHRTVIMSTHHLDEAEVLSDRIAFLERGGLKCCGSPFYLKDKLGQGYKLTLTKKMQNLESERIDNAELKDFIQAHVPAARLKEAHGSDLIYSLPPFTSSNASSYRSLLTALDSNLDALQLGGYGISDTTLEEVFLQLTHGDTEIEDEVGPLSISEMVSDTDSMDSFPSVSDGSISGFGDNIKLTGSSMVRGMALAWQQMSAILIKRFHHSRRDWKGLISQILLPVLFMVFAMGLGAIRSDLRHYPEMELSPALYNLGPSFSFFSNQNPNSAPLTDSMMSFPGIDNACLDKSDNPVCRGSTNKWSSSGNSSKAFRVCKCTSQEQMCDGHSFQPPHKKIPSSQTVYNLSGINVEKYLVATANDFIRNRYGGFTFGMPLPPDLKMDLRAVPKNRTLSKVWFNPEGQHTMPAYLNSLSNIILRSNLPADKDPRKYAISVSSHPYFGRPDDEDSVVQGMLQILLAMCVLTGYSITTASFAIYEVNEHHSGSKRLQHISGISEPFYWAVNFFYDMVMYLIPVTLTVGVIAAFQIPAFTDRQNLAAVALLLVLFGFATFPWMYLLSGVFKDAEMAFITYVCINLFISINTIMSTSILFFLSQISLGNSQVIHDLFNSLSNAFLIFPQFNFGNGLMKLARMNIEVQLLSGYGIDAYKNPFSTDALGWMIISSFIQGVVFFTLRLLLNRFIIRKVRNLICSRKTVPQVACEDEDEDVAAENLRVSSGAASTDILQVNQLTKVYQHLRKKVPAVKSLSVGIPAGECFGLLGVNGAGKTTTFKMLTGDVSPTDGTAQIRDWDGRLVDIMECRNKGINIGYCPQVDALDNLLTGKEHLYFYARIRGISKREIDGVVNYLLKRLELAYHRDIITDGYSCGTRRKLSTALALIGHPQILLLDEPSSGMDPRTKRHLWKIISEEVKGKCAVVLTSHSMEECEALCSRLAIMVKGQFRCLGSLQHIKNRFGSGFTVKMYLAEASCDVEAITGFMRGRFPSTYLKDQHSAMVEYHVPIAPGGVADIFDQLESNKNALQIKHFSVSQTTLDEVFINFAMEKIAMETVPLRSEDEYDDLDSIKTVET